ncbi:MAG: Hpt domain-containing protein [Campylobacterales bacterium]|nr:Hpt domain-containing protein [Campylobacterales bacterium]
MLLYNHKQEFIGIDDEGLKLLNYSSFEELLRVCADVADLFANEPGYIYNFKNFGWIDFILHSDSDTFNAIVHANGRVFSCQLSISQFYLVEHPAQNGYRIEMLHIKTMSGEDIKPHIIVPKERSKESVKEFSPSLTDHIHITPVRLSEPSVLDIPLGEISESDDLYTDFKPSPHPVEFEESLPFIPEIIEKLTPTASPKPLEHPVSRSMHYSKNEKEYLSHHHVPNDYLFDPSVAANELGLPVDLIEEFIGDFIQQSHEFKEELFEACAKSDFNNLHILSHKLKGVAANLRIEDALETLTIINTSTEVGEIEANLKYYYSIVAKLEGKEAESHYFQTTQESVVPEIILPEITDDIYAFTLKEPDEKPKQHDETPFKKEFFDLNVIEDEQEPEKEVARVKVPEEAAIKELEMLPDSSVNNHVTLHYDIYSTARALGIDPSFMQELIDDYKGDARIIGGEISNAISAFDTTLWNENASKLKGISDNLRLSEISDELTVLIKTHDAQEAKKAFNHLMSYLDQL